MQPKDKHSRAWGIWMMMRKAQLRKRRQVMPPGNRYQPEQRARLGYAPVVVAGDNKRGNVREDDNDAAVSK